MMTILMDRIFKKKAQEQDEDLVSMKSNMNRLLELCDQMLDYRKVENDQVLHSAACLARGGTRFPYFVFERRRSAGNAYPQLQPGSIGQDVGSIRERSVFL